MAAPTNGSDQPSQGLDDTLPAQDLPAPGKDPESERPPSRPSIPPIPPERYQLGSELGRGGMGRVVEAFDLQLGRTVALKEVLPKAGAASARRFAREVQLTAKLEHPSIVPLYDSGTTPDGRPYYVMRRVSGRPLEELIARSRTLDERMVLLPALQSAIDAVAHAHRRGVIHRDLKPANILVGDLGETIVIDWGLAKVIGEEDDPATRDSLPSDSLKTQMGSVFGTPGFMAPEQARGEELSTRGDVYALGATLYQLLAGTPPHAGNSATDVIDKTLRHHMIPLEEIAPGAPAPLVTIVTKALSLEQDQRYPDAGALGEDLRRFLAGQLVAAHHYTPRQRIMRFARHHRAPLGVAALALVAVAVLAWIGVRRVITERDAANSARASALEGQRAAETANRELAERHDALLVSRARARLEVNPTEALATLKQLAPTSPHIEEARAVAQAATVRGVAWAIQSTLDHSFIAEMSPDARQLLQVSRDGMVRVWDLDLRRLVLARPFARNTRAVWVSQGKLLVTHTDAQPVLLDPNTNTIEELSIPQITYAASSDTGERVIFETAHGVGVFDVATRTARQLSDRKAGTVVISGDGKALGWADDTLAIIADFEGREIVRHPGAVRIVFSNMRTAALLAKDKLYEVELDAAKPAWREIAPPNFRTELTIDLIYRGRELLVVSHGGLWGWQGNVAYNRGTVKSMNAGVHIADDNLAIVSTGDNKLLFIDGVLQGSVQLPSALVTPRFATRPGSSRIIGVAAGLIIGIDLDAVRPRVLPMALGTEAVFVSDDTLLTWRTTAADWRWVDVATGEATPIELDTRGFFEVADLDRTGRVLVRELVSNTEQRISLLHRGDRKARAIGEREATWARLVPPDAVVYGVGDARVFAVVGDEPPREIAKVEGISDGAAPLGPMQVAIHSSSGELLRIDIGTGRLERTTVPVGQNGFILGDPTGRVIDAEDDRIILWDHGTTTLLAKLDRPITRLDMLEGAIAVTLRDNETFVLELRPNARPERVFPPGRMMPESCLDGSMMIAIGNAEQINILELPSRTRWSLPVYYDTRSTPLLSPSRRRILQMVGYQAVIWQLPTASHTDFGAWLDEQTNATVDRDGELIWPWQAPSAAP